MHVFASWVENIIHLFYILPLIFRAFSFVLFWIICVFHFDFLFQLILILKCFYFFIYRCEFFEYVFVINLWLYCIVVSKCGLCSINFWNLLIFPLLIHGQFGGMLQVSLKRMCILSLLGIMFSPYMSPTYLLEQVVIQTGSSKFSIFLFIFC